jgi:protein-disulfide isomerase
VAGAEAVFGFVAEPVRFAWYFEKSARDFAQKTQERKLNSSLKFGSPVANKTWRAIRLAGRSVCAVAAVALLAVATLHAAPQAPASAAHPVVHRAPVTTAPMKAPVKTYGSPNAPIKIEMYTDYECPICRSFFEGTVRYLINDYVASGKVYVVHHDFPLQMHPYSGWAARWADAAASVGEFAAVEGALYDNQNTWAENGNIAPFIAQAMPKADFDRVAAIMKQCSTTAPQDQGPGVNPLDKSGDSSDSCPVDRYIAQDIEDGNKIGVNGTPTYVIYKNGQKITQMSVSVSWATLKQFLDSLQ